MNKNNIIKVVAAIIEKDNQILIAQRLKGEFSGMWEFPGGKVEDGETKEEALKREISEEFEVNIDVLEFLCTVEYDYSSFYLVMDCFRCRLESNDFVLHDHTAIKWINPLYDNIEWVPADVQVINEYREKVLGGTA